MAGEIHPLGRNQEGVHRCLPEGGEFMEEKWVFIGILQKEYRLSEKGTFNENRRKE